MSSCGEANFSEIKSANVLTRMVFDLVCWSGEKSRGRWCHIMDWRSDQGKLYSPNGAEERVGERWCHITKWRSDQGKPYSPTGAEERVGRWDDITICVENRIEKNIAVSLENKGRMTSHSEGKIKLRETLLSCWSRRVGWYHNMNRRLDQEEISTIDSERDGSCKRLCTEERFPLAPELRTAWEMMVTESWSPLKSLCTPPRKRRETAAARLRLVAPETEACLDLRHSFKVEMILSWRPILSDRAFLI